MVISFLVAIYFAFFHTRLGFEAWDPSSTLVVGVAITTVSWLAVTFMTPPVDTETLQAFYRDIRPLGRGWDAVIGDLKASEGTDVEGTDAQGGGELAAGLLSWFLGMHHGVRRAVRNGLSCCTESWRPGGLRDDRRGVVRLGSLQAATASGLHDVGLFRHRPIQTWTDSESHDGGGPGLTCRTSLTALASQCA